MVSAVFSASTIRANRARRNLSGLPFGQEGESLFQRLLDIRRDSFARALWVGPGDADRLRAIKTIGTLDVRAECVEGEIEIFPYDPGTLDLVVINGGLHSVNDLPGVLLQIRRALKPDGLFLCALPGGETLYELRACLTQAETQLYGGAAPRVHPMIDLPTMAALMQRAGFALPVVDSDRRVIYYRALRTLLRDLKHSGEGLALNARARRYPGRAFWPEAEAVYQSLHAAKDGLLRASFETIFAIGWGPADTQQKPLQPGSARNRLADALGTTEGLLQSRDEPDSSL